MQGTVLELPTGYYLERDPDILILRRLDGSMVGAFSARGATPEDIRRAAEETGQEPPEGRQEASRDAPSNPQLRARFFGRFEVLCGGETLHLGRNGKALTILKYLFANRSRPVSQDYLMGWLWPESNLKKARWSLNSAIHTLRKLLNGCLSSPSAFGYVVLEEGYYKLCPTVSLSTDVDDFDERCEEGRRLLKEGLKEEAAAVYERAIALYGDEYLVEDLYEDWTMVERERLANAYLEMLGWLALYYAQTDQHQRAIEACYRILEKDRCHEDSYRLLMKSYVRLGLRARALHQYRLCERTLGQEYGTSPSPETQSLYGSLLGDEAI